jgi:hypothetical protein
MGYPRQSMSGACLLALLLAVGVATAQEMTADDEARIATNMQVLDDYHVALARSLAASDGVDSVLAAAFVAEGVEMSSPSSLPPQLASATLFARAGHMAGTDAAVWFALAERGCANDATPCAADAARARLLELDGDNAAAWMLEFERQDGRGDAVAARSALARAAHAPAYRDYADTLDLRLLRAQLDDPTQIEYVVEPELPGLDANAHARFWKLLDSHEMVGTHALSALSRACDPQGAAANDAALQADCRAIGAREATPGASLFSQSHGVFLQWRLARDEGERAILAERRRELRWLLDSSGGPAAGKDLPRWIEAEIEDRLAGVGDVEHRRRIVAARGLVFPPRDTTHE